MNFEVFTPDQAVAGKGVPTVRVVSGEKLALNAAAQRLIEGTTYVQLLWDAQTKRIGIKPTNQSDPAAFRVTTAPSQSFISSKAFVQTHHLPASTRMRLAWDGTMWIASTTDPANPLAAPPEA